ncbi:MAG: restriction endonuclease subunit S, partial [Lachnospiraceae bacterium]|nr:restriction endonuclease subunit S [Lachnospiraceae bacterium]
MQNVSSSNSEKALVPKLRFPEFTDEYKRVKLKNIANKVVRNNPNSDAPIMMISAASGFIDQSTKYSRENAGKSLRKYTLLKQGELAYNHGASKLRTFGCCFELEKEEARIPYVYHTFSVNEEQCTHYIAKYLNNSLIDKQLKKLVTSSVRMDGLLNISYDEYMSINLNIPNYNEQSKIAAFLSLIDIKIKLQQQLIENLKLYKKGY